MKKNKIIILEGTEYELVPKRHKDDIRNKLPKNIDSLYGLWMIFEDYKRRMWYGKKQ